MEESQTTHLQVRYRDDSHWICSPASSEKTLIKHPHKDELVALARLVAHRHLPCVLTIENQSGSVERCEMYR